MTDPTPPPEPPLGSFSGNVPPPPPGAADAPRISTGGSSGSRRGSRTGYPPVGLARPSSTGSLREAGREAAGSPALSPDAGAVVRSSSSGSLRRPGSGGTPAVRNPSRETLEPLPPGSPLVPQQAGGDLPGTPRERSSSVPRLAPLQAGVASGASGSGSGSGRRSGAAVPPLAPLAGPSTPGGTGSGRGSGRAAGVPPLDLAGTATGSASGSKDGGSAAGGDAEAAAAVPPPPAPATGAARFRQAAAKAQAQAQGSDGAAPRGPVKWVPHTHSNPKHAKFCFICLHGKLEGQGDDVDREVQRQKQEEEDLPSPVDMKELGYLVGEGQSFRRCNADFERDNVTACWFRQVQDRVYDEVIKGMVAEQNSDISLGIDVRLTDHDEDEKDREVLRKLFTFSDEEEAAVEEKLRKLGDWCTEQEKRLIDVHPKPVERPPLPEVPDPTPEQLELLEYQPLVDLSSLTGESAADAREAMRAADAAIGASRDSSKAFEGFKVSDLPPPRTYPDMPEAEVVPYPLGMQDIPPYEPMQPPKPEPFPIEACIDPFERPFLFLPEFHETIMPEFEDTTTFAEPRCPPPEAAKEEWLATTRSIFPENNPPGETWGWGWVPERKRLVVPLIDEPYLPPYDIVGAEGGGKKLMMRGLWDAELFTTEGKMVPPLKERGKALYQAPKIEHPDEPLWSTNLAPPKSREEKIKELVSIIPVKSFARFKPKKVEVELPDFLWNLAREDAAGQGLWDVIAQRHEIPREIRRQREEADEQLRQQRKKEEDAVTAAVIAEEAATVRVAETGAESEASEPDLDGTAPGGPLQLEDDAGQTLPSPTIREQTEGMPDLEVEVPEPPTPSADPPHPVAHESHEVTMPGSPEPAGASDSRQQALQAHQQRVQELVQRGGEGRKVQELLADDRFLDNLAEKISNRLGGTTGLMSPSATHSNWASSTQMGTGTGFTGGRHSGQILRPEPPSFAEPLDDQSRATLPPALMGNTAASKNDTWKPKEPPPTINDVNVFTQEKMRGDCYVRLLILPEPNAARKDPVPYVGEVMDPDHSLVADTGRPNIMVPSKLKKAKEDGEDEDDDEDFQDFERNDAVVFSFVRHNRYEAVQALIEQETETLTARDEAGNNLLHVACQNNNRRIVKLLLKNGISVNDQNSRGNTPLHYCNQYGFTQLADYLIAHGADESIPNHQGLLPAQGVGRSEDAIAQAQRQLQADRARGPGGL